MSETEIMQVKSTRVLELGKNLKQRLLVDKIFRTAALGCVVIAIIPLGSILVEVFKNGAAAIDLAFLTEPPGAVGEAEGGIAPAIQGTLILIGLGSLLGVPAGVLMGIYLSEFGNNKFAKTVRFFNDVLTEFPSIVVGIFAFMLIVLVIGSFSVWAGAFALSIIMLPIVARTTEEALKLVPQTIREAALALGVPQWRSTFSVLLASAKGGLVTGVMLAVARIAGETAPLILTILGSSLFFQGFDKPLDALPLRIWRLSLLPYDYARLDGWGAALILILIVLSLNVGVRILTGRRLFVLVRR
ncbi:MAG: phosphate ABC transporter permease PstA [Nitrososphaerales archaeon]